MDQKCPDLVFPPCSPCPSLIPLLPAWGTGYIIPNFKTLSRNILGAHFCTYPLLDKKERKSHFNTTSLKNLNSFWQCITEHYEYITDQFCTSYLNIIKIILAVCFKANQVLEDNKKTWPTVTDTGNRIFNLRMLHTIHRVFFFTTEKERQCRSTLGPSIQTNLSTNIRCGSFKRIMGDGQETSCMPFLNWHFVRT